MQSRCLASPSVRAGLLLLAVLVLSACATAPAPPPTGSMWAFFTDADLTLGPRAVFYTSSQVACEQERRRRVEITPACIPVIVSPGTGYYAVSLNSNLEPSLPGGGAFGSLDQERCERLRTMLFRTYTSMGDCGPVAVQRAP